MKRFIGLSLLGVLFLIGGCKVGPNYCVPNTPMPTAFVENKVGQMRVVGDENLVHWWECVFQDACLNELLEEALRCNFDLRIAMERVCQSRANYWMTFTAILPEFDVDFQASRFRSSQSFSANRLNAGLNPWQSFFQTGLTAIWEIDLFGKNRRNADSAYYLWQASAEDARGVKLLVLSEVANTYVMIRYLQVKVGLARQLVRLDENLLKLSNEKFQSGLANEEAVLAAVSTMEADKAAVDVLESELKANIYSLAVLLGRPPEGLLDKFVCGGAIPNGFGKIPATLPCDLLRRRPDIASAERMLAAQTEQIGVAVAELFPKISLIGSTSSFASNPLQGANAGFSSDHIRHLFKPESRVIGIGGLVTLPVFDFGKRCANIDIQKFLANEDYLSYEKAVITALQEVETTFSSYFKEEERLWHLRNQVSADERSFKLYKDQFQAGLVDYSIVLTAQKKLLGSMNGVTDSEQALSSDLIAIYKAIGGDW